MRRGEKRQTVAKVEGVGEQQGAVGSGIILKFSQLKFLNHCSSEDMPS